MTKYQLEQLLSHIVDICDGINDPYEDESMRYMRIRELASLAINKKQDCKGMFQMPNFKKKKK